MKLRKLTLAILIFAALCWRAFTSEKELNVFCSTFPIYQITRNVVGKQKGVKVKLMLPSQLGCPHDYALTPKDMQKLAKADVLIINALGLEEFLGAPLKKANPKLKLIDSSKGIKDTIKFTDDHDHGEHHHHDEAFNPHLFVNPAMQKNLHTLKNTLGEK